MFSACCLCVLSGNQAALEDFKIEAHESIQPRPTPKRTESPAGALENQPWTTLQQAFTRKSGRGAFLKTPCARARGNHLYRTGNGKNMGETC